MDNHIHFLWEQLKMNGKETPKESFEKYTGHTFLKELRKNEISLSDYATELFALYWSFIPFNSPNSFRF